MVQNLRCQNWGYVFVVKNKWGWDCPSKAKIFRHVCCVTKVRKKLHIWWAIIPYLVLDSFLYGFPCEKKNPNRLPLAGDRLVSVNGSTFESQKASKKTPNGGTTNAMSKNSFGSRSQTRLLEEIDGNIDKVMEVPFVEGSNRSILGGIQLEKSMNWKSLLMFRGKNLSRESIATWIYCRWKCWSTKVSRNESRCLCRDECSIVIRPKGVKVIHTLPKKKVLQMLRIIESSRCWFQTFFIFSPGNFGKIPPFWLVHICF